MPSVQGWYRGMTTFSEGSARARFQTFEESASPKDCVARLAALRRELARRGLDGFIVPRADAYQNEYVPPSEERLAFLTGFTGSAGTAVVLAREAAIFVDGRYTLQVREQTDARAFAREDIATTTPSRWLALHAGDGAKIGYDPWLMTPAQVEGFERALAERKAALVAVDSNPLDAIWTDRPAEPDAPVALYSARLAGADAHKKLARIVEALGPADGLVLTDPHAVAWTFNIRGGDVAHTPLPLARAIVPKSGRPKLYVAATKLRNAVRAALEEVADVAAPLSLAADLKSLGAARKKLRFDAASAPAALVTAFREAGGAADIGSDPVALMKARKSPAEQRGSRAAHLRDGAAICRFLAWLEDNAPRGTIGEIDAAVALENFRSETGRLKDVSFPTISAFGPHAASPHYRVTRASDVRLGKGIYLVDSGAQYEDGTTDITRTICIGRPTPEMRDRFTRVLKGHIAIARAVFPKGTSGAQIDALARTALWDAGLDFDHGTGHGIGAYLSVHEGPQRISKLGTVALEDGMILSNEPGYYKAGAWGIRIENLILVERRAIAGAERAMLGFETLTFAPIARDLVDPRLMTKDEIAWLDAYHVEVRRKLSSLLDTPTRRWLAQATRKIAR
jgi:Xaa-Pro aminopeptidase